MGANTAARCGTRCPSSRDSHWDPYPAGCSGTGTAVASPGHESISNIRRLARPIRPRRRHAHRKPDARGCVDEAVEGEDVLVAVQAAHLRG